MNEFPLSHPSLEAFVRASDVVPLGIVMERSYYWEAQPTPQQIEQIMNLMTPQAIRSRTSHGGEVMSPNTHPHFDALLADRERIRDLELVAIQSSETHEEYQRMRAARRTAFLPIVQNHYLGDSSMAMVREMYPANLPSDVAQHVLWIGDDSILDTQIADFIARTINLAGLTVNDIILFERPRVTQTQFTQAATPEYRHIHLWMRQT